VNRQLLRESQSDGILNQPPSRFNGRGPDEDLAFPRHLDPEWIALEAFEEGEDEDDDDASDTSSPDDTTDASYSNYNEARARLPSRNRSSLDSRLVSQIENLALGSAQSERPDNSGSETSPSEHLAVDVGRGGVGANQESFMARSPFGAITSSLSLLEMLIRLTSLQEFQQASHLSIPDHVLTFFMEETSTTGLRGEAKWRARNEAKRRVGFDPYTDSPTK